MLATKADELDQIIRRLTPMRDGLRHAAACPAPSSLERRTFRRILRVATTRTTGAHRRRPALPQLGGSMTRADPVRSEGFEPPTF